MVDIIEKTLLSSVFRRIVHLERSGVEEISKTVEEMEYQNECAGIFKCSVAFEHSYCKEESSETE